MNEADTRAELIEPLLKEAGWGVIANSRINREVIAPGRLIGEGMREEKTVADYVLLYQGEKLAVVEAKKRDLKVTEGLAQAKDYALKLQTRFAYSTNGLGIYEVDMLTGIERYIEQYPSPQELWQTTFSQDNQWRNRFATIPFETKSGTWQARYYQHNAIRNVLEAICEDKKRILLTMATGTGKTCIAFQIAWKLFQSSWNISGEPERRPRILFLADRNILANQAFNAFSAFPDDALIRIDPNAIKKRERVPKNGSVFFTIFQTFMSGKDKNGNPVPKFGQYAPDFFDFIIIDECHRGGASDESTWREILDHFSPAVQLGLTATPRQDDNADTYDYFGQPVYTYALKEGINDGYLTPFKVRQIETNLDNYIYSLEDDAVEGEIEKGKTYTEEDFNSIIEIAEREKYRVQLFMEAIDQNQKTIVFCANQKHALAVRDLINQIKVSTHPNYCVRVTANDKKLGEQYLSQFQDNDRKIPTIITTSKKLSTGVDARNVRNIVLMRPIKSMIEFKQIIGRGTRVFEGKDYFTIYDFVKAYEHFNDPNWDGEPQVPVIIEKPQSEDADGTLIKTTSSGRQKAAEEKPQKIVIRLADGKERTFSHTVTTTFVTADGQALSVTEFIERLYGQIPELFVNYEDLKSLWSRPETRRELLKDLEDKGYGVEQLTAVKKLLEAEESDLFDVLAHIAFNSPLISRGERVLAHKSLILILYDDNKEQEFLNFLLEQYLQAGEGELERAKLPELVSLKYHTSDDAVKQLGSIERILEVFLGFQEYLYI